MNVRNIAHVFRARGYAGRKIAGVPIVFVNTWAGSRRLSPKPSQRVWNHSPDGFNWGYGGSGPAQLALAILLHFTGNRRLAVGLHQLFKSAFVAVWGETWRLDGEELAEWLAAHKDRV